MLDQLFERGWGKSFNVPPHLFRSIYAGEQGSLSGGALRQSIDPEAGVERYGIGEQFSEGWKPCVAQRIDFGVVASDPEPVHENKYDLQSVTHTECFNLIKTSTDYTDFSDFITCFNLLNLWTMNGAK